MGRSVRYNLDGMADLSETSVKMKMVSRGTGRQRGGGRGGVGGRREGGREVGGASVRYSIDGMADLSETSVKARMVGRKGHSMRPPSPFPVPNLIMTQRRTFTVRRWRG